MIRFMLTPMTPTLCAPKVAESKLSDSVEPWRINVIAK
jgi:hypothetical protein